MIFFSLISSAFSSIFYGVIITVVIMAILYAVLKYINDGIVRSVPFFATGVVLAVLLIIQCSLMVGAIQAKGTVEAAQIYLRQMSEDYSGTVGAQDSQEIFDQVTERFPLIGTFIGYTDFSGYKISELPEVIAGTVNDYFTSFIWHRILWIIGFVFIGCLVPMLYDNRRDNSIQKLSRKTIKPSYKKYDDF